MASVLAAGGLVLGGAGCSTGSDAEPEQFSGGGIDLTCAPARGIRFDGSADAVGAATPQEAVEGVRAVLEEAQSDISLPDGDFIATGIASGNFAKFTLIVDDDTAATVEVVNPGSGWVVNSVTACA